MRLRLNVKIAINEICHLFSGCSYLYEVQNEVHNNSSLEIYYQVYLCMLVSVCSVTDL